MPRDKCDPERDGCDPQTCEKYACVLRRKNVTIHPDARASRDGLRKTNNI